MSLGPNLGPDLIVVIDGWTDFPELSTPAWCSSKPARTLRAGSARPAGAAGLADDEWSLRKWLSFPAVQQSSDTNHFLRPLLSGGVRGILNRCRGGRTRADVARGPLTPALSRREWVAEGRVRVGAPPAILCHSMILGHNVLSKRKEMAIIRPSMVFVQISTLYSSLYKAVELTVLERFTLESRTPVGETAIIPAGAPLEEVATEPSLARRVGLDVRHPGFFWN